VVSQLLGAVLRAAIVMLILATPSLLLPGTSPEGAQVVMLVALMMGLFVALSCAGLVWLGSGPEGGVRMNNEMEEYAQAYIEEHGLLNDSERLLAYYDLTIVLDSTEAAIVTDERVVYHKNGRTTAIRLADTEDIRHRQETLIGDVIEVSAKNGAAIKIEIAPFNQGESFVNVLMKAWEKAKQNH